MIEKAFGLSKDAYLKMLEFQQGLCALCGNPETAIRHGKTKELAVDHDHQTGAIRGLLCHACNTGLGLFKDDSQLLTQAIAYMEQHREIKIYEPLTFVA